VAGRLFAVRTPEELLRDAETIAVVGASPDPARPSYGVMAYLIRSGYRVLPVNPSAGGELLGQRCYGSLAEIQEPVDLVDVFRRPEHCAEVARDAAAAGRERSGSSSAWSRRRLGASPRRTKWTSSRTSARPSCTAGSEAWVP